MKKYDGVVFPTKPKMRFLSFDVKLSKDNGVTWYQFVKTGGNFYEHVTEESIVESLMRQLQWAKSGGALMKIEKTIK